MKDIIYRGAADMQSVMQQQQNLKKIKSMFGDILLQYRSFNYTYDDYIADISSGKALGAFVKVWTGR